MVQRRPTSTTANANNLNMRSKELKQAHPYDTDGNGTLEAGEVTTRFTPDVAVFVTKVYDQYIEQARHMSQATNSYIEQAHVIEFEEKCPLYTLWDHRNITLTQGQPAPSEHHWAELVGITPADNRTDLLRSDIVAFFNSAAPVFLRGGHDTNGTFSSAGGFHDFENSSSKIPTTMGEYLTECLIKQWTFNSARDSGVINAWTTLKVMMKEILEVHLFKIKTANGANATTDQAFHTNDTNMDGVNNSSPEYYGPDAVNKEDMYNPSYTTGMGSGNATIADAGAFSDSVYVHEVDIDLVHRSFLSFYSAIRLPTPGFQGSGGAAGVNIDNNVDNADNDDGQNGAQGTQDPRNTGNVKLPYSQDEFNLDSLSAKNMTDNEGYVHGLHRIICKEHVLDFLLHLWSEGRWYLTTRANEADPLVYKPMIVENDVLLFQSRLIKLGSKTSIKFIFKMKFSSSDTATDGVTSLTPDWDWDSIASDVNPTTHGSNSAGNNNNA